MRIATFNLEDFGGSRAGAPDLETRLAVLRPQLERLRADVLCLQEVNTVKTAGERRASALERLIEGTPYAGHRLVLGTGPTRRRPADVHNLAVLTRLPVRAAEDIRHDLVEPPRWRPGSADPPIEAAQELAWDRPIQHLTLDLPDGRPLDLFNLHLRAPLAAPIPGQKAGPFRWKTVSGWAEGFFQSAVKRAGQALELRLAIERVFDARPDALILVCGDFNADDHDTALRLACAGEDDTGAGTLATRVLTPVARSLPADRRYTVLHHGRPLMLDHILASRMMFGHLTGVEIHNEMLDDELIAYRRIDRPPESLHAPMAAEFTFA
jgi:endonuclease/exonuclease/phosphatase family metal-dependent hydrolase